MSKNTPPDLWVNPGTTITTDGRRLAQITFPAMIRLVSSVKSIEHDVKTHISSLKAVNPINNPDPWERKALENLEKGEKFQMAFLKDDNGRDILRYMKPVYIERACLNCHEVQGYKIGDVRAGYTATIPVGGLVRNVNKRLWKLGAILAILGAMGLGVTVLVEKQFLRDQTHMEQLNEIRQAPTGLEQIGSLPKTPE